MGQAGNKAFYRSGTFQRRINAFILIGIGIILGKFGVELVQSHGNLTNQTNTLKDAASRIL